VDYDGRVAVKEGRIMTLLRSDARTAQSSLNATRGRLLMRASGSDHGSGSILGLAVIGATMTLTAVVVPAFALLAVGQSVRNAADAAALAAADAATGAVAGVPCDLADAAAMLNGATVTECTLDGLIASVTVARVVGGFTIAARARAGPPDE
jgi:secretion/DNA translocation related TadE-like protein